MELRTGVEAQQKVTVLLEEMGAMLGMLPRLLEENAVLKSAGEAATHEMENLRTELAALRSEIPDVHRGAQRVPADLHEVDERDHRPHEPGAAEAPGAASAHVLQALARGDGLRESAGTRRIRRLEPVAAPAVKPPGGRAVPCHRTCRLISRPAW
jgi:hypothetical protein